MCIRDRSPAVQFRMPRRPCSPSPHASAPRASLLTQALALARLHSLRALLLVPTSCCRRTVAS
eukprot:5784555-Alexandrium_andersonii.AAC.1